MSAPNPEMWRATETMVHGATGAGRSQSCVAAVISLCDSVARRRALAELLALGQTTVHLASNSTGEVAGALSALNTAIHAIRKRIAEIEAEEG